MPASRLVVGVCALLLAVYLSAGVSAQVIRYPVQSAFSFGEAYHTVAALCLRPTAQVSWIAAPPGSASVQPALDWFVRKAIRSPGGRVAVAAPSPVGTANTVTSADPIIAAEFRRIGAGPATAAIRACFVPQPVSGNRDPIAAFVNQRLPAAAGVKARYVLLWWRGGANEPFRNTQPADMNLLVQSVLARGRGATPVLIGDIAPGYAVPPGAVDLRGHHARAPFNTGNVRTKYTAQLQMFDYMIRTGRVAGQIGWLSGGMDGAALLGMKTVQFMFQSKTRMQRWSGGPGGVPPVAVPTYATISCPRVGHGNGLRITRAEVTRALNFILN